MSFTFRESKRLALLILVTGGFVIQGCGRDSGFASKSSVSDPSNISSGNGGDGTPPVTQTPPHPAPNPPVPPLHLMAVAPLWEKAKSEQGPSWSQFAAQIILTEAPDLMKGTADVQSFCPSYFHLTTDEKVNFWVYLVSAVVKYESGFEPTSRLREIGLGTDGVTHLPVYSEGLLQLSYQDQQGYPFCNEFDWAHDEVLSPTDPRKTILDPIKNLRCGIRILNKVVGRHNLIAFDSGHYWSTLMPKHSPEHSIQSMTNLISICRK
jgi:hypothetical protein